VTASIGAVTYLTAPDDIETLLHRADALMYAAKAAGRNRVSFEVVSPVDTVAGARGPI
jgi:PleD family two-component response regulator